MTNDEWRMTITAAEIHRETGHRMFSYSRICEKPMAQSKPMTNDDEDRCLFPQQVRTATRMRYRTGSESFPRLRDHSGFVFLPIAPSG
jgi:hypothetical protein